MDNRQPVTVDIKAAIAQHLASIPEGKRGALLVIADTHGTRAHVAANLNNTWLVAFEAGKPWKGPVTGEVMLVGSW